MTRAEAGPTTAVGSGSTGRPVVVGVDGSAHATRAAVWAGAESELRHRTLRVVSVLPAGGVDSARAASDTAEEVARARPELPVDAHLLEGDPADALVAAGADAELLVVGARGLQGLTGLFVGSVSSAVAARATCPTVVVRGLREPFPSDPVVLGVDGTPAGDAAVGFAFTAADRYGVPLVAVHVWHDVLEDPEWSPMLEEVASDASDEAELLAERLAGWGARFPDVEVVRELPADRPVRTLVSRSAGARLLVVGQRPRGRLGVLHSVSRSVVARAHCPVAVVPPSSGVTRG